MKDYYYILGVTRTASTDAVKQAYHKLSVKFHPDKNDGDKFFEDRFKEINEAYEVLGNSARRASYDTAFAGKAAPEPRPSTNQTPPRSEPARIISFTADKSSVAIGDVITFSWEVKNATSVELKPFGKVLLIGNKAIKVLGFNQPTGLLALLEAKDGMGNVTSVQLIIHQRVQQPSNEESIKPIITSKESNFAVWVAIGIPVVIISSVFLFKPGSSSSQTYNNESVTIETPQSITLTKAEKDPLPKREKKEVENTKAFNSNKNKVYNMTLDDGTVQFINDYIHDNIKCPDATHTIMVSGDAKVSILIARNGKIKQATVLRGLGFGVDEEIVNLLESMPDLAPGEMNGEPVEISSIFSDHINCH